MNPRVNDFEPTTNRLLSHGSESDLFEHTKEVMFAGKTFEESLIIACHDVGKSTIPWQHYIQSNGRLQSPHRHAAVGGLLAASLALEMRLEIKWVVLALHVVAAHHSYLDFFEFAEAQSETQTVLKDEQARWFFSTMVPKLVPETKPFVHKAWGRDDWSSFHKAISALTEYERIEYFFAARDLLGRLCFQDHESAKKQSGGNSTINKFYAAYPSQINFRKRPKKIYDSQENDSRKLKKNHDYKQKICSFRSSLRDNFLGQVTHQDLFTFIDAPTGLGKTECMLSAAEKILERGNLSRIVYAVPIVAIADQIFADYMTDAESQIWNYQRKQTNEEDNLSLPMRLGIAQHPFSLSYNVTTFNQVVGAIYHPHRMACIKGLGLRNAAIIMDEFHKLPFTIIPYFFRLAEYFAEHYNCRFILGSATPLSKGLVKSDRLKHFSMPEIYRDPLINNRRQYRKIRDLDISNLAEKIRQENKNNLLVVLNLVGKGTWLLRKELGLM